MSKKAGYLRRYLEVIRQIRHQPYIGLDELVEKVRAVMAYYDDEGNVGVSKRTILRDLQEIRDTLDIGIEHCRSRKGYYIPQDEQADFDLEHVLEILDLYSRPLPSFVYPEKRKARGAEHLLPLINAIKKQCTVQFVYRKFDLTQEQLRKVQPCALKEFKGRWYLLAMEVGDKGKMKAWGLDRISDLQMTRELFDKDPAFTVGRSYQDCFGIFAREDIPTEEVVLSFDPVGGSYIETFPLHTTQETILKTDAEIRIRLHVKVTYDFIMELLSQTQNVTVVAPVHLRATLRNLYEQASIRHANQP